MKVTKIFVSFCLLHVLAFAGHCLAGEIFQGKVVGISDGDTITVLTAEKKQIKVRLYGIDCPESRQAFGNRAKQAASELVFGRVVRVEVMHKDRYSRTVGIVTRQDGKNLNGELVAEGLAWVYPRYCKASICGKWRTAENSARGARRGLWADREPMPPWAWRKIRRHRL